MTANVSEAWKPAKNVFGNTYTRLLDLISNTIGGGMVLHKPDAVCKFTTSSDGPEDVKTRIITFPRHFTLGRTSSNRFTFKQNTTVEKYSSVWQILL